MVAIDSGLTLMDGCNRTLENQCRRICAVALAVGIFAVVCELFLVSDSEVLAVS